MKKHVSKMVRVGVLGGMLTVGFAMPALAQDTRTYDRRSEDVSDRGNLGWIGLLGLAGLAGLVRRERKDPFPVGTATATRP